MAAICCGMLVLASVLPGIPWGASGAAAAEGGSPGFTQVDTLPLLAGSGGTRAGGWLIINPHSRRIYEVFEAGSETTLQSFDLDTLQPRHREVFTGLPIVAGYRATAGGGGTLNAGEVVHAVDQAAGRIYLPLMLTAAGNGAGSPTASFTMSPDGRRPFGRIVAIDERKFDQGDPAAFASFDLLKGPQARLQLYYLMGLTTSRRHLADPDSPAALLGLFAAPDRPSQQFATLPSPSDHTLVQWPTDGLRFEPLGKEQASPVPVAADWEQVLAPCARASVTSPAGSPGVPSWDTNFQWGLFAGEDAVWTACQSEPYTGVILRVGLARDPTGRWRPAAGDQQVFPVSQPISDLFVDEGGGRLLLRSWGEGGTTWWAFDTGERRYTGSVAATSVLTQAMGVGIDPTTGRLYGLTRNYRTGNHPAVPVRGGLFYSDTRLEPTPPMENVRPELAYPSYWRIWVDPPTRRFFVRRGTWEGSQYVYPSTTTTAPAPAEPFYRVFKDNIPIPTQPGDVDDSAFTTDVKEAPGITQASYLGSGSGFGARIVLTGGYGAATAVSTNRPVDNHPCGKDDREFLIASVGGASVSDVSIDANATSLDADSRTQAENASCFPLVTFDAQNNSDPKKTKDGVNDYRTSCLDIDSVPSVPKPGFTATVVCDPKTITSQGSSTVEAASIISSQAPLKVAYSHSETVVQKDPILGGIIVKVTSIAKGIEIPGVATIAVIKAETTSRSGGRVATAQTTFKRTICGVHFGVEDYAGCLSEQDQQSFLKLFNDRFTGKAQIRLRNPDPKLAQGSHSGYQAAIQRDRKELFADRTINRDNSLIVSALELVLYNGDGGAGGAGRQIFQFAGVKAATSYGIVCLYGQAETKACNTDSFTSAYGDLTDSTGLDSYAAPSTYEDSTFASAPASQSQPGLLTKVIRSIAGFGQRVGRGLLLALSSPMQGALVASVWVLLYLPHYLGARRRLLPGTQP